MQAIFVTLTFIAAGLVHLVPAVAVMSSVRIEALYGVTIATPEQELLFRHRALLFGVLSGLLLAAAWREELRLVVGIAGLISMLGYVLLLVVVATDSVPLVRVAWTDVAAALLLMLALGLHLLRTA